MNSGIANSVDDTLLQARIQELYNVLIGSGQQCDASVLLADEARLFLKQAIQITPPKNKAQGENAVMSDLKKTFSVAEDTFAKYVAAAFGTNGIDKWLTDVSGNHLHLKWDHLDSVPNSRMGDYHQSQRNSRGRVRGNAVGDVVGGGAGGGSGFWPAKYVVTQDSFVWYYDKVRQRVGMRKAGWIRAYMTLGGNAPAWVKRHASKNLGGVENGLSNAAHPSIKMFSHAPGAKDDEAILHAAFKVRIQNIVRRMKLIASGYAQDVARKMRVTRKATVTDSGFNLSE